MLRRLYDWTMGLAAKKHADWGLASVSFAESSFFPIPPDILLIPMVLAQRHRAWILASLCTVMSVLGGLAGYAIGYFLFESIGQPVIEFYGYGEKFSEFKELYNEYGAWIVFAAGVTPFPYKIITIASGVTGLSLPIFIVASIVARALRFFIVAGALWYFGEPIRAFIEKYLGPLFVLFVVMLFGGYLLIKAVA
jgi:membrane protein YqaA with SNARE-associated domain